MFPLIYFAPTLTDANRLFVTMISRSLVGRLNLESDEWCLSNWLRWGAEVLTHGVILSLANHNYCALSALGPRLISQIVVATHCAIERMNYFSIEIQLATEEY